MRSIKFPSLLRFEKLEDRQMMAADIDLENDILTINGTNGDDQIIIDVNPNDPTKLLVTVRDQLTNQILSREDDYEIEDVQEIVANGWDGNDFLWNLTDIRARFYGGAHDDVLFGGRGNDLLDGQSGDDVLMGDDGEDVLIGGSGDDHLLGGSNNDTLEGGSGHDSLNGGGGDDDLTGGSGNDTYILYGMYVGSDVIHENASADTDTLDFTRFNGKVDVNLAITTEQVVHAEHLRLRLTSATGIENVIGSAFEDRIYGNSRNNELSGLGDRDQLYGREGADTLRGGEGHDWLFGEGGNDFLYGGEGSDMLWGGAGDDELYGEAGSDHLYGELGVDTLDGGEDNDHLDAGYNKTQTGRDRLRGGAGQDTFVAHRNRANRMQIYEDILDFQSSVDQILAQWH